MKAILLAIILCELNKGGTGLKVESETRVIDPGHSVFVRVELRSSPGARQAELPDLRERVEGFSLAEDFTDEPCTEADGTRVQVANWRLVPEPCAALYRIRPFAVGELIGGPIYFESPVARDRVAGTMEVDPRKDLPPLSWGLVGLLLAALVGAGALVGAVVLAVRLLARRIREHRMSPIERAWAELDRLLGRHLPARGRYKDFYIELTMVVRRYIQRKYAIRAPHMTTDEFLREAKPYASLREFLESADLVKFAGVEATVAMADEATQSARAYLKSDNKSDNVEGRV